MCVLIITYKICDDNTIIVYSQQRLMYWSYVLKKKNTYQDKKNVYTFVTYIQLYIAINEQKNWNLTEFVYTQLCCRIFDGLARFSF